MRGKRRPAAWTPCLAALAAALSAASASAALRQAPIPAEMPELPQAAAPAGVAASAAAGEPALSPAALDAAAPAAAVGRLDDAGAPASGRTQTPEAALDGFFDGSRPPSSPVETAPGRDLAGFLEPLLTDDPAAASTRALAREHFGLFTAVQAASGDRRPWLALALGLAAGRQDAVGADARRLSSLDPSRVSRLLLLAQEDGLEIPSSLRARADEARRARAALRAARLEPAAGLSASNRRDLTRLLAMLSIRRSRPERIYQRAKPYLGLTSRDLEPVIQAGKFLDPIGDEARLALERFNERASADGAARRAAFDDLMASLFDIYQARAAKPIDEPWFVVDGKPLSLVDFINREAYRQPELKPSNRWMTVARIRAADVRMPGMHGRLDREMWWNRGKGIHPIGTVRISRNFAVGPDGRERVESVEVLYRGPDKIFVPFRFVADADGRLRPITGPEAKRTLLSCYGCHLRLSGVLFGTITMKGYTPAPGWYINAIDFTQRRYFKKFRGLVRASR